MPRRDALQELEDVEQVFAALAHRSRRQVLLVLRFRGGSMSAGDIAARFACTWPTTTSHLRVLTEAGLIEVRRVGRERRYTLRSERLLAVAGGWLAWFEPETPRARGRARSARGRMAGPHARG